ncbi:multicopper oxidase [Polyporus arcularius HHB13444]|uniref:laccase n=1 Tax=Polyporus arcularius HHB13444 TaxID=1314778 RepID=A0A5C3PAE1_9APHY|nr:multicopper oxidase [Polyporus arcularius HHB13444]
MLYMRTRAGLVFIALGLFDRALGSIGPVANLPIVNKVIAPDGFTRDTVLAGGQFPGPLIVGNKGDNFRINVIDQLKNETLLTPTSIHWHGMFQHTTAWADGPAFVTQCPITSGDSFLYNFHVPGQAGTFWYHSHLATQYCDGLRGPLVIYDPQDPYKHLYDVDDESTIITIGDWYHLPAAQVPIPAVSDSTLINGLGRFPGGPLSPLAVINVVHGKRYRFRLINVACDPNYIFNIDGHEMTIIEADGQNTHPVTVDSLQIFVAQRYSFILEANQPVGNYWIRAKPSSAVQTGFENGINSAILRYHGAPNKEPAANQTASVKPLNETSLHPLTSPAAPGKPHPGGADVNLNLNLSFNGTEFFINGAPFIPPTIPVLLQILSGNVTAQSLLPPGSVYNLPLNSVIEVSIPGGVVNVMHPFHLHGHAFSVVRSAGSTAYNYVNPVRRDTVNIGLAGDNVTIRFETDNPGPWFLHCHIDFHLVAGLAIVFAEDAPDVAAVNPVPESWKKLCPTYYEHNHKRLDEL